MASSSSAAAALDELENFAYSSSSNGKRPAPPQEDEAPAAKRPAQPRREAAALLAEAEADLESSQVEVEQQIDANGMKRMVLSIEKRINENMQLRMKYADKPEKFMDSELELYQELKRLHAIATAPELYPTFVRTKCVPSLLSLLAHENADISIDVVDLLHEMTESEDAAPDDLLVLVDALLENGTAMLLMEHMGKLTDESEEEAAAIHNTLAIFEAFLEAKPEAAPELASKAGLLAWLLARLKVRAFHANKLYASELLSVLLQEQPENQLALGKAEGILPLLTAASHYKRKEPQDAEESELIENVFNCLCTALLQPANQLLFLKAEGIELMILTVKEGKYASRCALKVIDFALMTNGANCERFVDIRGFKTLFPLVGAAPAPQPKFAKGRGEREAAQQQHDEHVAGVLCTLMQQLGDERRLRLLGKFAEDEMAKLNRVLQLRAAYQARVEAAAAAAADAAVEELGDDEDDDDDAAAEGSISAARQLAGGHTLQLLDMCCGYLASSRQKALRQRVLTGLYEGGHSLHDVWEGIQECVANRDEAKLDAATKRSTAEMSAAVEALLAKYRPAADADAASSAAGDEGSAAAASDAAA